MNGEACRSKLVNGRARLSTDPALLEPMAVNGRIPTLAILVDVDEVFLHCAKAFRRSKLWNPERRRERREMPSLRKMILDQTTGAPDDPEELRKLDEELESAYRESMY